MITGADIDIWSTDNAEWAAHRRVCRLHRIRINGTELIVNNFTSDDEFPIVEFGESLDRHNVLTVNLKNIVVRSLNIAPKDPGPYAGEEMPGKHGVDIQMWDLPTNPSPHVSRPCMMRLNGTEIAIAEGSAPFVHVRDFGSKGGAMVVDINGIIVHSLRIMPGDPARSTTMPLLDPMNGWPGRIVANLAGQRPPLDQSE